jgi:CheY-like chemotaxis protein
MESYSPTVLYVEDDEGDRYFMHRAFATAGLGSSLQTVSHGEAAIQYLSGFGSYGDRARYPAPHLVLLDLNLPVISGFEVLRWIREHPSCSALPVIIFSSSTRDEDRVKARELGANEYWEKPATGLQYTRIVSSLLEHWLSSSPSARRETPDEDGTFVW